MKKSVAQIIFQYLQEQTGEWHGGFEFVNREVYVGGQRYFLGSSSDRKARLLAENGDIERTYKTMNGTRYAFYRSKPTEPVQLKMERVKEMV